MAEHNQTQNASSNETEKPEHHATTIEHVKDINEALTRRDSYQDDIPVTLGWRSWLVVFVTLYR